MSECEELVADCRLRAAFDLFVHTWDPVVLAALRAGPRRRQALRTAIGGISDKVLTETLHRLVANGLVGRQAHAQAPPRVEYRLTALGESLVEGPMAALAQWTITHGDDLLAAQEQAADTSTRHPADRSEIAPIAPVRSHSRTSERSIVTRSSRSPR
ncbi:helix-turn-helix domain-containing protein [Pseudonocardia zijingensis]|jgi:DNA-binding HxlR family transcriptional regulator|uniref:HTH hxlR-type domain-containing protein n=1 Tax=Pseudonocardia zijingensis TaxID=153376 RepID=A0ABN1P0W6_9PSEU